MTFKHKLSRRLALLRDQGRAVVTAALAVAAVSAREKPLNLIDPNTSTAPPLVGRQRIGFHRRWWSGLLLAAGHADREPGRPGRVLHAMREQTP